MAKFVREEASIIKIDFLIVFKDGTEKVIKNITEYGIDYASKLLIVKKGGRKIFFKF